MKRFISCILAICIVCTLGACKASKPAASLQSGDESSAASQLNSGSQNSFAEIAQKMLDNPEDVKADDQSVYSDYGGTTRLELVDNCVDAIKAKEYGSFKGYILSSPTALAYEVTFANDNAMLTICISAPEMQVETYAITDIYNAELFYLFTDHKTFYFSIPKVPLNDKVITENYQSGSNIIGAPVTAEQAMERAVEVSALVTSYCNDMRQSKLASPNSGYGIVVPESYSMPATGLPRLEPVVDGAATILGNPYYQVSFYEKYGNDEILMDAYYIDAQSMENIFMISMVAGELIPIACRNAGHFTVGQQSNNLAAPTSQAVTALSNIIVENEFEIMIKDLDPKMLVRDNEKCISENVHLIKNWVENYEKGIAGSVAVYYDGGGFPSTIFIMESDGTQSYVITGYKQGTGEKTMVTSSLVVERALDFVFGADTELQTALIIHKRPLEEVSMKWNSFDNFGITTEAAEKIAKETFNDISKYQALKKKVHGGGIYILEKDIKDLDEPNSPKEYYKTIGAVQIANQPYYIVSMYFDEEEMKRSAPSGNALAVSGDGKICFLANMANSGWILVKDTNEKTIVPASISKS